MLFTKGAGAGAKCDHQRIGVRARVRANQDLDVRGACVRRKKRSQLTRKNQSVKAYLENVK
jgi:hypothetical protein